MKEKKTILICLEKLDIGGVETHVYNQAISLKNRGYIVVILSENGIYTEELKKRGIVCEEFSFKVQNYFEYEKIKKLLEIIKKYDVNEVHINQFTALTTIFPACLIANIPYVSYVHTGVSVIEETFEWYENQASIYRKLFELYFKYSEKIVIINEKIRNYIIEKYKIENKEKIIYIRNSINFKEYATDKNITECKKFIILSRLEKLKNKSVIDGINLFNEIYKEDNTAELKIAGDGADKENLEKYVEENYIKNVKFLGAISNVREEIEQSDVVIGVGRCILEAIAMKRIAIISGYTGLRDVVTEENMKTELDENFVGKQLEINDIEKIKNKLIDLDKTRIKEIVEYNYNQTLDKLDIDKNICILDNLNFKYEININEFMISMFKINDILGQEVKEKSEKIESNWQEHLKYKEYMEQRELHFTRKIAELEKYQTEEKNKSIFKRLLNK